MIEAAIIGGGGYTAGELIRILIHHPEVNIQEVVSESQAGKAISEVHADLVGETDLEFSGTFSNEADVIFLCMGHGKSSEWLQEHNVSELTRIVDLSTDYRHRGDHDFIYGLPEINREAIKMASKVANPGCFATCIQLGILPLVSQGWFKDDIHVTAITGSTGAGQQPTNYTHFSWRNNNVSVYKAFSHQHLKEIKESVRQISDEYAEIHFIPMRGNFSRGILAASYIKTDVGIEEAKNVYKEYYTDSEFVHVVDQNPYVKQVVNTNKAVVYLEKEGDQLLVISVIDNLLKGASGQAVQNMNLMFGLDEAAGLNLKSLGY